MNSIIENKDYLLVNLDGPAKFDIEGIGKAILDGRYDKYPDLSRGRMTMMCKDKKPYNTYQNGKLQKSYYQSLLEHSLFKLIEFGTQDENGWYFNEWTYPAKGDEKEYTCILDVFFYDEFVFLTTEGLIDVTNFTLLTEDNIWNNFSESQKRKEHPELQDLFDCKTLADLKKEYKRLLMLHHPDIANTDSQIIRDIIESYSVLIKKFK